MKEKTVKIFGEMTKVSVCNKCRKELIGLDEAIRAQRKLLPKIHEKRKVIKVGISKAVTIPKKLDPFFRTGDKVIINFDPKKMEITIRKE